MKRFRFIILLIVFFTNLTQAQETEHRVIEVDGEERTFQIFVPDNADEFETLALMIVYHGGGSTGLGMMQETAFEDYADDFGTILIYPDGIRGRWNYVFNPSGADDAEFTSQIIENVISDFPIDRNRIYLTGYSNGASMALRMGCEFSEEITAVATIATPLLSNQLRPCANDRRIPIMIIMGSDDRTYGGYGTEVLSFLDTKRFLRAIYGCTRTSQETIVSTENSPHSVTMQELSNCGDNSQIRLYTALEAGHYPSIEMEVELDNDEIGEITGLFYQFFEQFQLNGE